MKTLVVEKIDHLLNEATRYISDCAANASDKVEAKEWLAELRLEVQRYETEHELDKKRVEKAQEWLADFHVDYAYQLASGASLRQLADILYGN